MTANAFVVHCAIMDADATLRQPAQRPICAGFLCLPHTSAFLCLALRCVTMRQDIISIFTDFFILDAGNLLAYIMN